MINFQSIVVAYIANMMKTVLLSNTYGPVHVSKGTITFLSETEERPMRTQDNPQGFVKH